MVPGSDGGCRWASMKAVNKIRGYRVRGTIHPSGRLVRPGVEVIAGDAGEVLRRIPTGIAGACITSPPYWGMRDYGHPAHRGWSPRMRTSGGS